MTSSKANVCTWLFLAYSIYVGANASLILPQGTVNSDVTLHTIRTRLANWAFNHVSMIPSKARSKFREYKESKFDPVKLFEASILAYQVTSYGPELNLHTDDYKWARLTQQSLASDIKRLKLETNSFEFSYALWLLELEITHDKNLIQRGIELFKLHRSEMTLLSELVSLSSQSNSQNDVLNCITLIQEQMSRDTKQTRYHFFLGESNLAMARFNTKDSLTYLNVAENELHEFKELAKANAGALQNTNFLIRECENLRRHHAKVPITTPATIK